MWDRLPHRAVEIERIKAFPKDFYKCIYVSTRVGLEISRSVKLPDLEDYCMQEGKDHVVYSQKRSKCCKRQTFSLIQPSKPGRERRHQTVISIGSSKFFFYNSYFLSMAGPRPVGAGILSEPPLPVSRLLSFCSMSVPTSCHAEKVCPGLWSEREFGPVSFIVSSVGWHGQITGLGRKIPMSPCQV